MSRRAQSSIRLILGIAIALIVGAGVFYIVRSATLTHVQVTRLVEAPVVQAFYATGTVVPEREYPLRASVAGHLALEPGIDKGSRIEKGQRIARVISDDLEKKLKQTQAELVEKTARADEKTSPVLAEFDKRIQALSEILQLAKNEHQRLVSLSETDNAKVTEVERALITVKTNWSLMEVAKAQRGAKVLELKKELDIAQGDYDIAKWNADQQEVISPIDAVVLDWPVPDKTRLAINDHIMLVADVRPERLVMRAAVDEEDKNRLRIGQQVMMTLYAFPDDQFEGKVKTIYDKADAQRRTFEVDVEITREPESATTQPSRYTKFAAGMTGELAFVEKAKSNVNILPRQALQGDLFYMVKNGRIDAVKADAGIRNVTRVEVLSGIARTDQVMISPIGKLRLGQAVKVEQIDPRVAADLNKPKDVEIFKGGF